MKKNKQNNIYQFKIVLEGSRPMIWRRIQVPEDYTFWKLHNAIQDVMNWGGFHLHMFETLSPNRRDIKYIGEPDKEDFCDVLEEGDESISDWFSLNARKRMRYVYDFGDSWHHLITMEKILPREEKTKYPICIAGALAAPPEDCGGIWGYYQMLEIVSDPKNKEYEDMIEWLGDEFDPEEFDASKVKFRN